MRVEMAEVVTSTVELEQAGQIFSTLAAYGICLCWWTAQHIDSVADLFWL